MSPLHPDFQAIVEFLASSPAPHPRETPIGERRAAHLAASALTETSPVEMAEVRDINLSCGLEARLYIPSNDAGQAATVYFHGGGFVLGTLDSYDGLARHLADAFAAPVISVQYRLAPEHVFPAAVDDVIAATRSISLDREALGLAGRRLVVAGDSAGGTLAAVTAQELRGTGIVDVQVLLYPTMGPELVTDSAHRFATGYILEMDHLHYHYREYLGEGANHTDPRITPLLADHLENMPATIIVVAECDPLRDEAVTYAGLLEHYGTHVDLLEAKGMVHSFFKMGGICADVADEFRVLGEHVRAVVSR
jgi:acetyl esterase